MAKKEAMTPEEVDKQKFFEGTQERQRCSAVTLLFISNMLTDFQLNPNFKFQHPVERQLWLSLRELLNLPVEVLDDTVKLNK